MGYAKWLVLSVLVAVLAACGQLGQPEKAAQPGDDGLTVQDTVVLGDGVVANNALNLGQIQQGSYAEGNVAVKIVCQGGSSNRAQEGAMGFTGSSHSEVSLQGSDLTISHNWATLDKCNDQGATPNPTGTVTIRATAAANATLGERSVSFTVTSTDANLPSGQRSITFTVKYEVVAATPTDTTPPTVTVSFPPEDGDNGWFKTSPVTGSVSASDDASVSEITCSGAALSSVTGIGSTLASGTLTVTQQGTSNVTCTAKDGLDNSGAATGSSNTATVKLDSVAPTVTPADVSDTIWRNTPLSQTFAASDATSGLADNDDAEFSLTVSDKSTNASTPTTASYKVKDNAGNETTRTLSALIDTTAPTITLDSISPAANDDGWNNSDVTVTWSCADALSGIESNTVSQTVTGEGDDLSTTGTCADNADNTASDTQTVKIDRTDPTITAAADREPNVNGWYSASVTVSFTCGDTLSGVASCPEPVTVDGDTPAEGQDVSGTATDVAGNSASSNTVNVKLDTTAPTITATATVNGQPYDGNWTNQTVTVSFTCSDALSGLDGSCPADVVISSDTPAAGQDVSASVSDLAGNSATSDIITVKVDKTAPTASASRSPAANEHGWNNSAVTVSFSGSDDLSGIASCSTDVVLSGEGADQSASGTCTDNAGNVSDPASVTGINIDLTAPTVNLVGGPAPGASYYFGFVPSVPTCSASDGLSDVAGSCNVSGYRDAVGEHTVTATASDNAGNSASDSVTYTVLEWSLNGFYRPVSMDNVYNTVKGGSTVPLKFEVFAGATELTSTSVVKSFVTTKFTCNTSTFEDNVDLVTTGGTSLRYDTTDGQFIQNWQTPRQAGACYRVTMTTQDGSSLVALFKLK